MSTSTPFIPTNFKTMVIHPGETKVIKKNLRILRTINEGNVTVTSTCSDIEDRLNETSEALVHYAVSIEVMDELINRVSEDFLKGVGLGNDFYPFVTPLSLNAFKDDTGAATSGAVMLYRAMVEALPNGQVFLRSPSYEYGNWAGPSGDTSRDNVLRGAVKFFSFPSIIEELKLYILYENNPTFGTNLTRYDLRIYPSRI